MSSSGGRRLALCAGAVGFNSGPPGRAVFRGLEKRRRTNSPQSFAIVRGRSWSLTRDPPKRPHEGDLEGRSYPPHSAPHSRVRAFGSRGESATIRPTRRPRGKSPPRLFVSSIRPASVPTATPCPAHPDARGRARGYPAPRSGRRGTAHEAQREEREQAERPQHVPGREPARQAGSRRSGRARRRSGRLNPRR